MKIETHLKNLKESIEVIEESIEKGLVERQRNIGFNTSAACIDMLEILLHKNDLIDPGFIIKHEWLKSANKIKEKFPFDFSKKNEIIRLISKIEEKRDILCYGKPQKVEIIQEVINNFNTLKEKFKEAGLNEI
ncbi:hypothetical protein HYV80_06705 [Candidatus Woesearchaeota archaeon]|nr:hypothetical protein [Candidatus Woesearchaeota archaeon]